MNTRIKATIHFGLSSTLSIILLCIVSATAPHHERTAQVAYNPAAHAYEQLKDTFEAIFTQTEVSQFKNTYR